MDANKFYDLKFSSQQVLLKVHPPEGGQKANLKEIQKELRRLEVSYRLETLFDIYRRASNDFEPLTTYEARDYELIVEVSEDHQQAWMTVIPPAKGDTKLTPEKVKEALESNKIEKGIQYDQIKKILASGEAQEKVLVARGIPNLDGTDGEIEFVEKPNDRFALGDNTADYRELNLIDNVKEGSLIARISLPTTGKNGFNVHAQVLKNRPGKRAKFKLGRNVRLNEEGTELYATKDGYLVRTGIRISVENVLEVNNVDSDTGNIRFYGVVKVRGQVEDSYEIEAERGIEVNGTVGKAKLTTKGDIRIGGGVYGATLESGGNIQSTFISDAKVSSGGHVLVDDYILHSEVVAKKSIKVASEPKGFIQGGRTKAGTFIWTPVVGSEISEEHTALEVGGGVNVRKRFDDLNEKLDHNLEVYEKLRKNLDYLQRQRQSEGAPTENRKKTTYETMLESGRTLSRDILNQAGRHHELLQALVNPEEAIGLVVLTETAYPGTTIQIQTSRVSLKDPMEACGFAILNGVLKAMPLGAALKLHKQQRKLHTP